MADISMCLNHNCDNRLKCYRYTAKANPYRQSYMDFRPNAEGVCEDFTDNGGEEIGTRQNNGLERLKEALKWV